MNKGIALILAIVAALLLVGAYNAEFECGSMLAAVCRR